MTAHDQELVEHRRSTVQNNRKFFVAHLHAATIELVEHGNAELALDVLAEWDRAAADIEHQVGWLGTTCLVALISAHLGDPDRIERHLAAIERYHDQVASTGGCWLGSTAHYAGVLEAALGRLQDAERHFAEAAELNEAIGAPFFLARTRVAWARLLLDRRGPGDPEQAEHLLQEAHAGAVAYGCAGLEAEIARLLVEPNDGRARHFLAARVRSTPGIWPTV